MYENSKNPRKLQISTQSLEIHKKKSNWRIFENRARKKSKNLENYQTSNASRIIGNGSLDYPKVFLGSLEVVWADKKKFFWSAMICDFFTYMTKLLVKFWNFQVEDTLDLKKTFLK